MSRQSRFPNRTHIVPALAVIVALVTASAIGPIYAQTGGGKDTKQLRAKLENARKAIESTEKEIQGAMALYNELIEQKAKKPDATFKKLAKGVDASDKAAKGAGKSVEAMHKDLDKFYAAWEKEIGTYTSDDMKAVAQKSFDQVKGKFDRFDAALKDAAAIYDPFIISLRDQVAFMGRDLSPEALTALTDTAQKLNASADELYQKIDQTLNDTGAEAQAEGEEAPAEEPAQAEGEEADQG